MFGGIAALLVVFSRFTIAEYPKQSSFTSNLQQDFSPTTRNKTFGLSTSDMDDVALSPNLADFYNGLAASRAADRDGGRSVQRPAGVRVRRDQLMRVALNTPEDTMHHLHPLHLRDQNHRLRKRSLLKMVLEVAVFSDQIFYDYTRSRYPDESPDEVKILMKEIILSILSSVQLYFDNPTFGLDIDIRVVDIIFLDPNNLYPEENIRSYLDRFCQFQKSLRKNGASSWDHALLLTGFDLYSSNQFGGNERGSSGMAFLSGMCNPDVSCTIAEARSLGSTSLIIAHELAHNLGADHDGVRENSMCDIEKYIMGPKLGPGATEWSNCTRRQIGEFLDYIGKFPFGGCLEETRPGFNQWDIEKLGLPGRRFTGEDQCNFLYGKDWSYYQGYINAQQKNDPCEAIWCRRGIQLRSPNAAALQGTNCGEKSVCFSGVCKADTDLGNSTLALSSSSSNTSSPTSSTPSTTTSITTPETTTTVFPVYESRLCNFFLTFGIRLVGCH